MTSATRANSFPVGYHDLHPDISINFQLNRFYGWVGDDSMLTEMREAAAGLAGVQDYPAFTKIFLELGDKALIRHETLKGAYYLRLAEFFLLTDDPRKLPTPTWFSVTFKSRPRHAAAFPMGPAGCPPIASPRRSPPRAHSSYSAASTAISRSGCPPRCFFATPATTRSCSRGPAREQRSNWRT